MQKRLLSIQKEIINKIIANFEGKVSKECRVLYNRVQDKISGGITTEVRYLEPGYNRALFITWDRDPVNLKYYIYRLEITEKYDSAKIKILVDVQFIESKLDKDNNITFDIDRYVKTFLDGICDN